MAYPEGIVNAVQYHFLDMKTITCMRDPFSFSFQILCLYIDSQILPVLFYLSFISVHKINIDGRNVALYTQAAISVTAYESYWL